MMFSQERRQPCQVTKMLPPDFADLNLPVVAFPDEDRSLNEFRFFGNGDDFGWMQFGDGKPDGVVPEVMPPAAQRYGFLDLLGNPCDPSQVQFDGCLSTTGSSDSASGKVGSSNIASLSTTSTATFNDNAKDLDKTTAPPSQSDTAMDREARVLRYREKRKKRRFEKQIRYASRKAYAEMRPRVKGRFAKATDDSQATASAPCNPDQLTMGCWFHPRLP